MNRVLKLVFAASCLCGALLSAQIPVDTPYEDHGSYAINLQNLSIVVNVPIRAKAGLIGFNAGLTGATGIYNSDGLSKIGGVSSVATQISANNLLPSSVSAVPNGTVVCSGGGIDTQFINFVFSTGDGNAHLLPPTEYLDCNHPSFTDTLVDGSGYTVSVSRTALTVDVYAANGAHLSSSYSYSPTTFKVSLFSLTDTNGNTLSLGNNLYTDSLGLTVITSTTGTNTKTLSWTDVNGGMQQTVLTTTAYKIKTTYGCPSPNQDLVQTATSP